MAEENPERFQETPKKRICNGKIEKSYQRGVEKYR